MVLKFYFRRDLRTSKFSKMVRPAGRDPLAEHLSANVNFDHSFAEASKLNLTQFIKSTCFNCEKTHMENVFTILRKWYE